MTVQIAFVLALTLAALVVFVKAWLPPDGVAVGLLVSLIASGLLTPKQAFSAFGNEALITVAGTFVLAAGLIRTGTVAFVGRKILDVGRGSKLRILLTLMLSAAGCSAFLNNTPIVVIFLPIVLGIGEATGIPPSKMLIPVSYATIVGGMCTLIGTSTSVMLSSMLPQFGQPQLHFFEPLPLGLIGVAMTILYIVVIGQRLLPERTTVTSVVRAGQIRDYVTEFEVAAGSPVENRLLAEVVPADRIGVQVLQLIRGGDIIVGPQPGLVLRAGDLLIVRGDVNALMTLQRQDGLTLAPELAAGPSELKRKEVTLAELLISPASGAIGEPVRNLMLRELYGAFALAVQRSGTHIHEKVADLPLRLGDLLLIQADTESMDKLRQSPDFILLEGIEEQVILSHRAWLAVAVALCVVVLATLELPTLPISVLMLAGSAVMVLGGCLGLRDAYRAVDLPILVLIGGTISLGMAMQETGAAAWIAAGMVRVARPLGDVGLLSGIYLVTNVLTALISNNAAAVLMLPISLASASQAGLSAEPFILAVMFAASIDFSTPIGYQTNTIIYGPGGYRFSDYVKVGTPLNVLWWLLATALIPVFWPLRG